MTGGISKNKVGNNFYYYRCFNKKCKNYGKSLNAKFLDQKFIEYLNNFKCNKIQINIIKKALEKINKDMDINSINFKNKRIMQINNEIEKINDLIIKTNFVNLIQNYENKINNLINERIFLYSEIENQSTNLVLNKEYISNFIEYGFNMITNPMKIWQNSDSKTRQLLIGVVIGIQIFYNKKWCFSTPQIPLILKLINT